MFPSLQTLGKYRILEELGRGSFATVYRAEDTTLVREVALKILHPQLFNDPGSRGRFHREAQAIARLRHPRIITIHESGEIDTRHYIAMDLITGKSLQEWLTTRGHFTWDETLKLLGEVAEALDYAHSEGVIHRDLKPANIMLNPRSGAILTDFGFAKLVGESSLMSLSQSEGLIGTLAYIAPEIWDNHDHTPQSDIYALGCVVCELLTGQRLFDGKTFAAMTRQHSTGPQFSEIWPEGTPPGVESVLRKALARDPKERYASAGELFKVLKIEGERYHAQVKESVPQMVKNLQVLKPGDILANGEIRIEDCIGEGTFGVVYRAWDASLNRQVAVKELRRDAPDINADNLQRFVNRFRREARVQAQFNHPYIVQVYRLLEENDTLYLVMELVEGDSLRDVLAKRGLLPPQEAIQITLDLLDALTVVHTHRWDIIHRDIKPSNVLLVNGRAKLTDFGLAQLASESSRSQFGNRHPGTPLYMSPEQESTTAYLRPASDLYSVGCVFFEMLTGKPYKSVDDVPKMLRDSGLDSSVIKIVLRATEKRPEERYHRAEEFSAALRPPKSNSCLYGILAIIAGLGVL